MSLIPPSIHAPSWLSQFRSFVLKGNVVDLAVGIIVGAAFTGVVQSLVKDIFSPVIGLFAGRIRFTDLFVALSTKHFATLEDAQKAGVPTLNIGVFLNAVIQFLIIGMVVFWIVKLLTKLHMHDELKPAAPSKTETLLTEIRDLMKRNEPAESSSPGPKNQTTMVS